MKHMSNIYNTYLGQYGKMKHKEGFWLPLIRVDRSKQAFYENLHIKSQDRQYIEVYNYIKASI